LQVEHTRHRSGANFLVNLMATLTAYRFLPSKPSTFIKISLCLCLLHYSRRTRAKYWRQYVTRKELAFEFGVGEATAHDVIVWVENELVEAKNSAFPGRRPF